MVSSLEGEMKEIALKLYEISAFKFGSFTLKSGKESPVYFDLRVIISYPDIMEQLTNLMLKFIDEYQLQCDQLCGVPYTALPLATLLSVKLSQPMLIRRKEAKSYGTKKLIEGKFQEKETCLIIEDVVTTGSSVLETTKDLRSEGLMVTDAIVVVDRQQGGSENLNQNGVKMHSLFTLPYLIKILQNEGKIDDELAKKVEDYMAGLSVPETLTSNRLQMSFAKRADLAENELSKALFKLMDVKKSNLCLAADVTKADEILDLANTLGPYICLLKTHIDIVEDFSEKFVESLKNLAEKHNFLIMEDRKFADIGNTVSLQASSGIYRVTKWADCVTAHSLPGSGILKALKTVTPDRNFGVFLLTEMSCEGNLITADYSKKSIEMIDGYKDLVAGVVAQSHELIKSPGIIQLTPGCKLDESGDDLGQKYNTPEYLVKEKGADIAVVGRGIIESKNRAEIAKTYRDRLWVAYEQRLG